MVLVLGLKAAQDSVTGEGRVGLMFGQVKDSMYRGVAGPTVMGR